MGPYSGGFASGSTVCFTDLLRIKTLTLLVCGVGATHLYSVPIYVVALPNISRTVIPGWLSVVGCWGRELYLLGLGSLRCSVCWLIAQRALGLIQPFKESVGYVEYCKSWYPH